MFVRILFCGLLFVGTLAKSASVDSLLDRSKTLMQSNPDSSFRLAFLALQQAEELSSPLLQARSQELIAMQYFTHGAYNKALEYLLQVLPAYQDLREQEAQANVHNLLGQIYYYINDAKGSRAQHQLAFEMYKSLGHPLGQAESLGFIGHYHEKMGDYDKAIQCQTEALSLLLTSNNHEAISRIYGNIGSIYEDLEQLDTARSYFLLALEHNKEAQDFTERVVHYNNIGDTYRKQGAIQESIPFTEKALLLARELKHTGYEKSALKDLAKAYQALRQFEKSQEYLLKAANLLEDMYDADTRKQVEGLQALYEIKEKENEIALLQKDQELGTKTRNLIIGIGVSLGLLVVFFFYFQRSKSRQSRQIFETQAKLSKAELEATQLNQKNLEIALENKQLREKQLEGEIDLINNTLTSYTLQVVQKNTLLKDLQDHLKNIAGRKGIDYEKHLNTVIKQIDSNLNYDSDWENFQKFFDQVHPDFITELHKVAPDLTANEIRLCILLRLNISSKDIAAIMNVAPDSARIARYRLRKKLPIEERENLTKFLMGF